MSSMIDIFYMGGHGVYLLGSYGVTLALIVAEIVYLRARARRLEASQRRS